MPSVILPSGHGRSQVATSIGTAQEPAANPTAPSGDSWGYGAATLPLFNSSGNPSVSDVVQGGIGDCFMLCDLQQLAAQNPQFIKDHIKEVPNPNDAQHPNYEVQLFDKDGKPQTITVDGKQLLNSLSSPAGAGSHNPLSGQGSASALWPTIYEKAFAIANNEDIDDLTEQGGLPDQAWQTLTGQSSNLITGMPSTGAFLTAVADSSHVQVVGTIKSLTKLPTWNGSSATLDNGRYTVTADPQTDTIMHIVDNLSHEAWDLPVNHDLPVMGVSTGSMSDDSLIRVDLANPWGPSRTNQQNLQDIPYGVLKEVANQFCTLPIPGRTQAAASSSTQP